jgi:hypothetical protein
MKTSVHRLAMVENHEDHLVPIDRVDSPPTVDAERPEVLVSTELMYVEPRPRRTWVLFRQCERRIELASEGARKPGEALRGDRSSESEVEHLPRRGKPVPSSERLKRLSRQQEGALDVPSEVIGGHLVHEILDRLGRALAAHLVVAKPLPNPERKRHRGHPHRIGRGHMSSIGSMEYGVSLPRRGRDGVFHRPSAIF